MRTIIPGEGMMLYNADLDMWSDSVFMPDDEDSLKWQERSMEEYEDYLKSQEETEDDGDDDGHKEDR